VVENEWKQRTAVPKYVFNVIKSMPCDTHPMTLFSQAILALQRETIFVKNYYQGIRKEEYWEPMLEDSLNLTAKLPTIAAFIYNWRYKGKATVHPSMRLDWGANFAHMVGVQIKGYDELSRLYFLLHADHESGNVSAHATHLVGSSLSDVYYSASAAMNGLAGPLHGLANQECLSWLLDLC
jgi:citrate synthase